MCIDRLLFVCIFFVCTVTDFSGEDKDSGVKFCTVVQKRPKQEIAHFGELCSTEAPKSDESVRGQWTSACVVSIGLSIRRFVARIVVTTSNALRHGSHSFTCKLHHACLYFPAAKYHRPLVGTHFTVPRKVEGWVDLGLVTYWNKLPPPGVKRTRTRSPIPVLTGLSVGVVDKRHCQSPSLTVGLLVKIKR